MANSSAQQVHPFSISNRTLAAQSFWILSFALLTAIGAQIEIPHRPVPFTLQTFFVLLAGAMMTPRNAGLSMLLYVTLGAAGLPVFSGAGVGVARLLGPTGGYLIAFPIAAFVVAYLVSVRKELWWIGLSLAVGLLMIFTVGTIQLNLMLLHNWKLSFDAGFLIFSWWDLVKLFAVTGIAHYYHNRMR